MLTSAPKILAKELVSKKILVKELNMVKLLKWV